MLKSIFKAKQAVCPRCGSSSCASLASPAQIAAAKKKALKKDERENIKVKREEFLRYLRGDKTIEDKPDTGGGAERGSDARGTVGGAGGDSMHVNVPKPGAFQKLFGFSFRRHDSKKAVEELIPEQPNNEEISYPNIVQQGNEVLSAVGVIKSQLEKFKTSDAKALEELQNLKKKNDQMVEQLAELKIQVKEIQNKKMPEFWEPLNPANNLPTYPLQINMLRSGTGGGNVSSRGGDARGTGVNAGGAGGDARGIGGGDARGGHAGGTGGDARGIGGGASRGGDGRGRGGDSTARGGHAASRGGDGRGRGGDSTARGGHAGGRGGGAARGGHAGGIRGGAGGIRGDAGGIRGNAGGIRGGAGGIRGDAGGIRGDAGGIRGDCLQYGTFGEAIMNLVGSESEALLAIERNNRSLENERIQLKELHDLLELLKLSSFNLQRFCQQLDMWDEDDFFEHLHQARDMRTFLTRRRLHDPLFEIITGFTASEATTLFQSVGGLLKRKTHRSRALEIVDIFMVALSVLRHGGDFTVQGAAIGFSKATVSRVLEQFCDAVITAFPNLITLEGSVDSWKHHTQMFWRRHGLPYICGALDGSLIPIHSARMVRFLSCKMPGNAHDIRVLRRSQLATMVNNGWSPCPNGAVLADAGYVGYPKFVIPLPKRIFPRHKMFYKRCQLARLIVEHTLADIKNLFQILRYGVNVRSRRRAARVIKTAIMLYNFRKIQRGEDDDRTTFDEFGELPPLSARCPTFGTRYADLHNRLHNNIH